MAKNTLHIQLRIGRKIKPYNKGFIIATRIICIVCTIVCVKLRLDTYRIDCEAASWTLEKGYSKEYVHTKDRIKK